jgi:TetR/AcrR family transcriptional regulator
MEAAAELFGRSGFEGVRVEQIARQAGVNKAMISYHFKGKRGLYVAILEDLLGGISSDLAILAGSSFPADERLRQIVRIVAAHSLRHPSFAAVLIREVMTGAAHLDDGMLPRFLAIFESVREVVEAGIREGSFRPVDPVATHLTIIGSLVFFFATAPMRARVAASGRLPSHLQPPTPEAFIDHIQELLTRGLSVAAPGSPKRS